jgi:drug/metabolite transporter (DMT)-like permease
VSAASDRSAQDEPRSNLTPGPRGGSTVDSPSHTAWWIGPACGLASAVLYTLTNIALRGCVEVDAYLVSAVKAAPTVICLGPVLGWMATKKTTIIPSRKRIPQFILASFIAQFFGNVAFQKALEHIGLAASVPITLGLLIVGGALFGALLLREPVGRQKIIAMITLISAVIVLSIPYSDEASPPESSPPESNESTESVAETAAAKAAAERSGGEVEPRDLSAISILIGSGWAAVSGLAYAFFGVSLRQTMKTGVRPSATMFISGTIGTLTLWSYSFATLGSEQIFATSAGQWTSMIAAGVFNFSAFIAITSSLRLLPVVAVNLINASQVAMAAVAGVLLYREPITVQLIGGILLTIVGLMILARRTRAPIAVTD